MSKLCLGTVQFGMKYGIHNKTGQPTEEECFHILDAAMEHGIDTIDTARAYGTAEVVVGNYLSYRRINNRINIISKLRPNIIEAGEKNIYSVVRSELEDSLKRLQVSQLEGYLLHTPEYVYQNQIIDTMFRLKEEKLIYNVGVSIYNIKEGYEAIKRGLDYVQLPYSILDQRGDQTGFLKEAKRNGLKVFVRSVFLQGLFVMDLQEIPVWLEKAKPYLKNLDNIVKSYKKDKIELLLQFVKEQKDIDYLVFGVDTKGQLLENIDKFEKGERLEKELLKKLYEYGEQVDDSIILPSLWSNGKKAE